MSVISMLWLVGMFVKMFVDLVGCGESTGWCWPPFLVWGVSLLVAIAIALLGSRAYALAITFLFGRDIKSFSVILVPRSTYTTPPITCLVLRRETSCGHSLVI